MKIKERRNQNPPPEKAKVSVDVEETKRQIQGKKPLPKKFGEKIRHRDMYKKKKAKGASPKKNSKAKGKKAKKAKE